MGGKQMLHQTLRRSPQANGAGKAKARSSGSVPCVATHDVDAALEQAAKQGGRAHGTAFQLPGVGRFGLMTDAEGNLIALRSKE
jgi:predicted enzyme related to lactoylglutathione lyase